MCDFFRNYEYFNFKFTQTLSDEKEKIYNDNKNNIKNKLNILSKITVGLLGIQIIEESKGRDKRVLILKTFCRHSRFNKKITI